MIPAVVSGAGSLLCWAWATSDTPNIRCRTKSFRISLTGIGVFCPADAAIATSRSRSPQAVTGSGLPSQ